MLRAGVMAAGEMDVERRLDRRPRVSHQSPISAACRLVSDAANLQPAFPVQATSPARIDEASTASPSALIAAVASATLSSARPKSKGSATPSGEYRHRRDRARSWRGRASAQQVSLPIGSTTPIQFRPPCFCSCTPICAMPVERRPRRDRFRRHAGKGLPMLLLDGEQEFFHAHAVDHIFHAAP